MFTVYLALGANVGDKIQNMQKAVKLLREKVTNIVLAPVYETKPWGYDAQDNFLNTVLQGETILSPEELLIFIKDREKKIGRIRRFTNGPREIDIDILLYDTLIYKTNNLEIPHPRMHERDFVLQPFVAIAPNVFHPVLKKTIRQLLESLPNKENIIKVIPDTIIKI